MIDKDTVKRIKDAQSFSVRYEAIGEESRITFYKDAWEWGQMRQFQHWVAVDSKFVVFSRGRKGDPIKCFHSGSLDSFTLADRGHPEITAFGLLREGDEVCLIWIADNNCENYKEADLHGDEVYIQIIRNGKIKHEVMLGYQVSKNNSSRMIQFKESENMHK